MNITELAVRRPVTILMLVAGLVVAGLLSFSLLPIREMPSIHYPFLQVTVNDTGADPQDVRTTITDPLENALTTVNGIASMTSVSMQGVSEITLQFYGGTDINTAANNVAQALHKVAGKLPPTATLPTISENNPAQTPIMNLSLSGKLNQAQLYALAQNTIIPALESVPGVASVNIQGGLVPQVNVMVHPSALQAYRVSLLQITQAIAAQNASVPGGSLQSGPNSYAAATNSPYSTVSSLGQLAVNLPGKKGAPGGSIQLGQLATITQGYASPTTVSAYNGKGAVTLSISTASDANSLSVESGVVQTLARLRKTLPPGALLKTVSDTTVYTRAALTAVLNDLLLAVLLTAGVLFLFLRRLSHTFIVIFAIPTSLIATFSVMYALGFSLDLISMLALSLLIGILVDDSIVVLENIDRHLTSGLDPRTAAVRGRMEIGAAAVAITLTDVVVYAPVAFVHGTTGQLLREFGLTVVAATLFSLFVSFTLTPMLASRWLRPHTDSPRPRLRFIPRRAEAFFSARLGPRLARFGSSARAAYTSLLRGALRHRFLVVMIAVVSLGATLSFVPLGLVNTEYVPQENALTFRVAAQLPNGTSLSVTQKTLDRFARAIRRVPSVSGVLVTSGETLDGLTATNQGVITVLRGSQTAPTGGLFGSGHGRFGHKGKGGKRGKGRRAGKGGGGAAAGAGGAAGSKAGTGGAKGTGAAAVPKRPSVPLSQVLSSINTLAAKVPGLQIQSDVPNPLVLSGSQPVSVTVAGPQLPVLDALALQVAGRMQQIPGLVNVQDSAATVLPEWLIHVNPQAAATYGITSTMIGRAVQEAISGSVASAFQGPALQTNIVVELNGGSRMTPAQLDTIPVSASHGQMVTLGQVASVSLAPSPVALYESNRQLSVQVSAGISGVALGTAARELNQSLSSLPLPPGYTVTLGGQIAQQNAAFGPLLGALALSIALVYMLMAALYESLITPLVVLFSLPMASVGAFLALMLTGETLNIFSLIALIMLMGLVAKNAILLVDFTRQLTERGHSREEALVEAGRTRLRPIVMTTATMVVSMIPLALPLGIGSSDRMPVATVLIGGMTTSTLLTLIVVPSLYTYFDDLRRFLRRMRGVRGSATVAAETD